MTHEEKAKYHEIMVASWRIFTKERPEELFSDPWWESIIGEFREMRKPYIGTLLDDYVCHISQVFLDEHERVYKRGRRQKRVSETILPGPEGFTQGELQFSDPVCEVGGFKEDIEPFA